MRLIVNCTQFETNANSIELWKVQCPEQWLLCVCVCVDVIWILGKYQWNRMLVYKCFRFDIPFWNGFEPQMSFWLHVQSNMMTMLAAKFSLSYCRLVFFLLCFLSFILLRMHAFSRLNYGMQRGFEQCECIPFACYGDTKPEI